MRKCSPYQFECRSTKECIAIYNACDGIPQCADGSDEAAELGCPAAAADTLLTSTQQAGVIASRPAPPPPQNNPAPPLNASIFYIYIIIVIIISSIILLRKNCNRGSFHCAVRTKISIHCRHNQFVAFASIEVA